MAALDNALVALPEIAAPAGFEPTFSYEGLVRGYAPVPDPLAVGDRRHDAEASGTFAVERSVAGRLPRDAAASCYGLGLFG